MRNIKVSRPNSATYLSKTPIFEWCVAMCGSKSGHQKNVLLKKLEYVLNIR